jgi:very-short-patch-repair endonuclease
LDLAELQRRARHMRNNPTEPEKRLWRHLSGEQLNGHKFRRQQVIGWFIADFVCPRQRLIIEVDGDTHDEAKDRLRDDTLAGRGYRVLRVTNDDVMRNMDGVLRFLCEALCVAERPHPNPSPEGEGLPKAQKLLGISLEGSVG